MGVYATIQDVQARMPQFKLQADSKPTSADAETFILDVEAETEAALANLGYVIPITGAGSLAIVKSIVCAGAIARILSARAAAVGGDASVQSAIRAQEFYDGRLKALADPNNPLELPDAGTTEELVEKDTVIMGGPLVEDDGADLEPRIRMDSKF